jgi:hypothetical protein
MRRIDRDMRFELVFRRDIRHRLRQHAWNCHLFTLQLLEPDVIFD